MLLVINDGKEYVNHCSTDSPNEMKLVSMLQYPELMSHKVKTNDTTLPPSSTSQIFRVTSGR